ncbi:hypothetical protein [Dyadobacter sandarakinus]|uniref:DUF4402 domain-containing protein n=1 Tax=Dyadobacter sandarakinus TaxID=2747268 RepID=A0ABX7I1C6_9BACT|nr:hypothetical protein [Dyadobacter sandarakinus]QRQ99868.1 hypothetical protein HWI92_02510 [Dyadobacter sandarakinus]
MRYAPYIWLVMLSSAAFGQSSASTNVSITMPSVALIDLLPAGSTNITLKMAAPAEAGVATGTGTGNNSVWLVFTSAVTSGGSRSIKGDVVGTIPAGLRLRLDVAPYTGAGVGFTGGFSYVTSNKYLTSTSTSFIDNIKGAYTGNTYGSSGFRLTYSLEIQNYASIRSGTTTLTVRYTMADN